MKEIKDNKYKKFGDFEILTNLGHLGKFWKAVLQKDHVVRNG